MRKSRKKSEDRGSGPGRPTSLELRRRKEKILDVAYKLFIDNGFTETSLVEVARAAGVATRTIYQHYGDKSDLFSAAIDKQAVKLDREIAKIDIKRELFEVLLDVAHYGSTFVFDQRSLAFVRLMIAESNRFPVLLKTYKSMYDHYHTTVASVFNQLAAAGKIPGQDHAESTRLFIHLTQGLAPLHLTIKWISAPPSEIELRAKVELFILGRFGKGFVTREYNSFRTPVAKNKFARIPGSHQSNN